MSEYSGGKKVQSHFWSVVITVKLQNRKSEAKDVRCLYSVQRKDEYTARN